MHLFFSVGEPSGDQHAAELMREFGQLHGNVRFSGFGGPEMQKDGLNCLFQLTDMAVVGIGQVLPLVHKFYGLVQEAKKFFAQDRPDAVVLVDFPGFNWWIAAAAKEFEIPVYYYCPPQLWAWAPWRIKKVHRSVDCILSVLPFEADWYRDHGVDVEYVGHPFFDEVERHQLDTPAMEAMCHQNELTIGILPGSRKQELLRNFPVMLETMKSLYEKHPRLRFQVACYKEWHLQKSQELYEESEYQLPIEFHVGQTSEIIEASDFCVMVSGSVSLEMLARRTPAAVIYRVNWLTALIFRNLITVKYFSLPNLIAKRELMPEFPLIRLRSSRTEKLTQQLDQWISHPEQLKAARKELSELATQVVQTGGVKNAAHVLHRRLTASTTQQHERIKKAA